MKSGSREYYTGINRTQYYGILDAFHGETHLPVDEPVREELQKIHGGALTYGANLQESMRLHHSDLPQPQILRELAAEKLFDGFLHPAAGVEGVQVDKDEVIVCPYSSLIMLEAALQSIRKPDGVIICPEGYYKSVEPHITKFGMRIVRSQLEHLPDTWSLHESSFKISASSLQSQLQYYTENNQLCGVLLTLPGNPVMVDYSVDELKTIGRVLADSNVPVICDMAFDKLASNHIPIASLEVENSAGEQVKLYDRILSITGTSKGFNAFGSSKLGAACSGNKKWLEQIQSYIPVEFDVETVQRVRPFLELTRDEYFSNNRALMNEQQTRARDHIEQINRRLGVQALTPYGLGEGLFCTIGFPYPLLSHMGASRYGQLSDIAHREAGIDHVPLIQAGSSLPGIRFNIFAPRRGQGLWPGPGDEIDGPMRKELQDELFDRLGNVILRRGRVYYQ